MTEESSADQPLPESLPESLLEGGLEAFFRSPPDERVAERSVLKSFEARGGCAPQILLRDVGSGEINSPVVDVGSQRLDAGDRIQILGEIARGGMGVVFKGRDPDLGRDLAMKVLREDLGGDPIMEQRFIEEAQIGGQLQHPGIVPIYALGLLGDERPYFTMKLVRGRTLSELLVERVSETEDRPRFLSIFERVCQAMAYAHARGVVHRDLKPSNIMIGAFGETQIVDWGLAKVLPRGGVADERAELLQRDTQVETVRHRSGSTGLESSAGMVMGTPAYMPPEQARGEVEALDERSDVFSLGAILCAILTGKPPYTGEAGAARVQAAAARLDEVRERLASCSADDELVELCQACLAPEKADRPRTAGMLARRMSEYLASVEKRARAAQIAAAETRVRAREEKKLVVGLAAAVLLIVLAGCGGYLWLDGQRRERVARTDSAVAEALDEATRLCGQAESTDDPERWREALLAAHAARLVLEAREASPELAERVRLTADRIQREEEHSRGVAERKRRNRELLARLREIRRPESGGQYGTDWAVVTEQYREAFTAAGLELEGPVIAEAAARIRASGLTVELAAALDEWAAAGRAADLDEGAERLMRIALDVDEDPTRRSLRELIVHGDAGELAEFARDNDPEEFPLATQLLLANSLGHAGRHAEAVATLQLAQRRRPDDYAVNVQLARWLSVLPEPPWDEILGSYHAALALRPEGVELRHELGLTYEKKLGEHQKALEMFQESARRSPEDGHLLYHVASSLAVLGRHEEAIPVYRETLRREPDFSDARCNLGLSIQELGELDRAAELFRETIGLDPDHLGSSYNLGVVLGLLGDLEGSMRAYRRVLRIDPDHAFAHYNLGLSLAVQRDMSGARVEFAEAVRCAPDHAEIRLNLGIASLATGNLQAGLEALHESLRLDPEDPYTHHMMARALTATGDLDGAVATYHEALRLDPALEGVHFNLGTDLFMGERYEEAAAALREATLRAPQDPRVLCNLGLALLNITGRAGEGLEVLRRGHELGSRDPSWPNPSAAWVREAERRAALEAELLAIGEGAEPPEEPGELLRLAALARAWDRHALAADLYILALEQEAIEEASTPISRLDAARSAALAAVGDSPDAVDAALRREHAIAWLKEELAGIEELVLAGTAPERAGALEQLEYWIADPELAGLREPRLLGRLPVEEREAWLDFWGGVRGLVASGG